MNTSVNMRNCVARSAPRLLLSVCMKTQPLFLTRFAPLAALTLAAIVALGACAKSSDSSTTDPGAAAAGTTSATTVNAQCNAFNSSDTRLGGRIATYYNASAFVEDQLRVRLTSLTTSFDSNNYDLQFFRWKADANGAATLDSAPLSFTIYNGTTAISAAMTTINSTTVGYLRQQTGIGTSSSDFFNKVTIVVSGVDNSWEVLKAVLYSGPTAIASADALMPLFAANPNTYGANHAAVLSSLHPFWSQRGNSSTDAQWVSYSNQNCFQ
jgi:hypothetical protein